MGDSLLSRFRGAIVGAVLGKLWATHATSSPKAAFWVLEQAIDVCDSDSSNPFGNALLVELVSEQLLKSGRLKLEEPSEASQAIPWGDGSATQLDPDVWIALLPIILFFHEDDAQLASNLQEVTHVWQFSSEATEAVLGVGYAISLALRETLHPNRLLSQILDRLSLVQTNSLTLQFPKKLQTSIENGASLESIRGLLGRQTLSQAERSTCTQAVALAFYCFLGTPGDVRAGVMRSLQLQYQPQLVATLVGAIAGAYNGDAGIPLSWRVALSPEGKSRSWQLATQLWAAWSGICDPMMPFDRLEEMTAITAPGVLHPRKIESD